MRDRLPLALLLAAAGCSSASAPRAPLFEPGPPARVGPGSGPAVLRDVDGDGHADLVSKHILAKHVRVLFGDGKGAFAERSVSTIQFDDMPGAMTLGDVNGDGRVDMVILSKNDVRESADVLLGAPGGTFARAPGSPFRTGDAMKTYKPNVALVDVDEDGRLDLVTANGRRHTVEMFLGDGKGGFRAGPSLQLSADSNETQSYFKFIDVDADGHLDVVAATTAGLTIFRGDGKGGFAPAPGSPIRVPANPELEAVADVDGDARPDVVLSFDDGKALTIFTNRGGCAFAEAPGSPLVFAAEPFGVAVADADGDGRADLVVATVDNSVKPYPSAVVVLLGDGHGFVPAPGSPYPAGPGAYGVSTGDANEDGRIDLVASSFGGDDVTLLLGRR